MRARSSMTDWSWITRTVVGGIIVTVSPTLLSLRATMPSIGEATAESLVLRLAIDSMTSAWLTPLTLAL
jgi:hypothetical protein